MNCFVYVLHIKRLQRQLSLRKNIFLLNGAFCLNVVIFSLGYENYSHAIQYVRQKQAKSKLLNVILKQNVL